MTACSEVFACACACGRFECCKLPRKMFLVLLMGFGFHQCCNSEVDAYMEYIWYNLTAERVIDRMRLWQWG